MLDVRSVSVYFSIFYFKRDVLMDPALVKILVSDRIRVIEQIRSRNRMSVSQEGERWFVSKYRERQRRGGGRPSDHNFRAARASRKNKETEKSRRQPLEAKKKTWTQRKGLKHLGVTDKIGCGRRHECTGQRLAHMPNKFPVDASGGGDDRRQKGVTRP